MREDPGLPTRGSRTVLDFLCLLLLLRLLVRLGDSLLLGRSLLVAAQALGHGAGAHRWANGGVSNALLNIALSLRDGSRGATKAYRRL